MAEDKHGDGIGATVAMTDADQVRFIRMDGEEDVGLTVRGLLKLMAGLDLADVEDPARRRQLQRFQERGRALWAAEIIRQNPRELGDLLFDEFSGKELDDGIAEACDGNGAAFALTFETMLDRCVGGLS